MNRLSISMLGATLCLLAPLTAQGHDPRPRQDPHYDDHHHHEPPPRRDRDHYERRYDERRSSGWSQQLGVGGGWFAPWQGDSGHQVQAEFLATSPSGHFRWGVEFIQREYETRFFDVDDVDVDAYQGNLVFHYVINPDGLTPYIGAGLGLHANDISKSEVEAGNPGLDVRDDVGLGYGIFGILGLELPIHPDLSLFAEGRLNLAYQVTGIDDSANHSYSDYYHDRVDDVDAEDTGGGSAVFGVRFRF